VKRLLRVAVREVKTVAGCGRRKIGKAGRRQETVAGCELQVENAGKHGSLEQWNECFSGRYGFPRIRLLRTSPDRDIPGQAGSASLDR